ncbi:MAG TPA: acyl-CoA synthetase [Patescibacteria group bacterium]|nr:acyl-CoA synthetase [Patescibacteria group bacterium]
MAKARAKPGAKKGKAAAKGGSGGNKLLLVLTAMALVPFSLPTLMVLFVGLLPTLVAAVVERGNARYAWICVGGLNFAGLAPWLFNLWFGHHTLEYAWEQITSVTMLLTAFGASALGSLLYMATPPVVGMVTAMTSQRRAANLAVVQKKLVEKWGDGVVSRDEL